MTRPRRGQTWRSRATDETMIVTGLMKVANPMRGASWTVVMFREDREGDGRPTGFPNLQREDDFVREFEFVHGRHSDDLRSWLLRTVGVASSTRSAQRAVEYLMEVCKATGRMRATLYGFGTLKEGWDSYSADPINLEVIEAVDKFLCAVIDGKVTPVPSPDGGVILEYAGDGVDVTVEFSPPEEGETYREITGVWTRA